MLYALSTIALILQVLWIGINLAGVAKYVMEDEPDKVKNHFVHAGFSLLQAVLLLLPWSIPVIAATLSTYAFTVAILVLWAQPTWPTKGN